MPRLVLPPSLPAQRVSGLASDWAYLSQFRAVRSLARHQKGVTAQGADPGRARRRRAFRGYGSHSASAGSRGGNRSKHILTVSVGFSFGLSTSLQPRASYHSLRHM